MDLCVCKCTRWKKAIVELLFHGWSMRSLQPLLTAFMLPLLARVWGRDGWEMKRWEKKECVSPDHRGWCSTDRFVWIHTNNHVQTHMQGYERCRRTQICRQGLISWTHTWLQQHQPHHVHRSTGGLVHFVLCTWCLIHLHTFQCKSKLSDWFSSRNSKSTLKFQ